MGCFLTANMMQHDVNMRGFVGFFSSIRGFFEDINNRCKTIDEIPGDMRHILGYTLSHGKWLGCTWLPRIAEDYANIMALVPAFFYLLYGFFNVFFYQANFYNVAGFPNSWSEEVLRSIPFQFFASRLGSREGLQEEQGSTESQVDSSTSSKQSKQYTRLRSLESWKLDENPKLSVLKSLVYCPYCLFLNATLSWLRKAQERVNCVVKMKPGEKSLLLRSLKLTFQDNNDAPWQM